MQDNLLDHSYDTVTDPVKKDDSFGHKRMTLFFSVCLLLNNVTGPGMTAYPALFQQAGWLFPVLLMLLCLALSGVCGLCLIKAQNLIPGNENFDFRYEYSNIAKHYVGHNSFIIIAILFNVSMLSQLIPEIIQSAQVGDMLMQQTFGKSCALSFYPSLSWSCVSNDDGKADLFGANSVVISLGMFMVSLISIPLGYWNLDDNMYIQGVAAIALGVMVAIWVCLFCENGLVAERVPLVGSDLSQVLGIVVFNYSFAASLPSWINEKTDDTCVRKATWIPLIIGTIFFIIVGVFGGMGYAPYFGTDLDVLDKINQGGSIIGKITFFLFPLIVNLTSIPVYSIMIRYNLLSNNLCSKPVANFISVIAPWILTVIFYTGDGFTSVVNWAGTTVNGLVSFVVPLYIYILAVYRYGGKRLNLIHVGEEDTPRNSLIQSEIESEDDIVNSLYSNLVDNGEASTSSEKILVKGKSYNENIPDPLGSLHYHEFLHPCCRFKPVTLSSVIIFIYLVMIIIVIAINASNN